MISLRVTHQLSSNIFGIKKWPNDCSGQLEAKRRRLQEQRAAKRARLSATGSGAVGVEGRVGPRVDAGMTAILIEFAATDCVNADFVSAAEQSLVTSGSVEAVAAE